MYDMYVSNPDVSSNNPHMVSFESNTHEIYNLTTGFEMIGFEPKPDYSAGVSDHHSTSFHENRSVLIDDPSIRCVFPCEANERPSQGLSLSLSSNHPSTIGLQSFELRQQEVNLSYFQQQQQMNDQDGLLLNSTHLHQGRFMIRNSKYLGPAQELLNEFCNLGTSQTDSDNHPPKRKLHKINQWQDESMGSSSSNQQSLQSLELLELHKRKTKLLQILEEVDRRYKHYCDQMKVVVSSFEAVAGSGATTVYSAMASKAMSRHFRCLRDGIVIQIKETKKTMGEKDTVTAGGTQGETPRLRLLEQTLRQQRAFQQMSVMESHPWKPQRGLPEISVSVLRAWLFEHFLHPYPSDVDKQILARQTRLSRSQVSNWFINARVRLWKPMVEEMYMKEIKDQDSLGFSDGITPIDDSSKTPPEDQKPNPDHLVGIDSDCLSSIINNTKKIHTKNSKTLPYDQPHYHNNFGRFNTDSFGNMELNFGDNGGGNGGGGVSLTLGLQQHEGGGVSLAFSTASASQSSLLYPRDHVEDCQTVHYSFLDGEQGQNLPYRNLMGAQLLHEFNSEIERDGDG